MPNPYENLFHSDKEQKPLPAFDDSLSAAPENIYPENRQEPLDEILEKARLFQQKAEEFSKLLSRTNAVDHEVGNPYLHLFFEIKEKDEPGSLREEKACFELLKNKFRQIIVPMKELAALHLETVQQFNNDVGEGYFSIEKEDSEVKSEKSEAVEAINLQRKILADAAGDLHILEDALAASERRLNKYVDAGGSNNLSDSELALLVKNREALTSGSEHQFNYTFFNINLLDKAAMSLGFYLKETTAQYLQKLQVAFEIR